MVSSPWVCSSSFSFGVLFWLYCRIQPWSVHRDYEEGVPSPYAHPEEGIMKIFMLKAETTLYQVISFSIFHSVHPPRNGWQRRCCHGEDGIREDGSLSPANVREAQSSLHQGFYNPPPRPLKVVSRPILRNVIIKDLSDRYPPSLDLFGGKLAIIERTGN